MPAIDLEAIEAERARLRATYLRPAEDRPQSTAHGVHHICVHRQTHNVRLDYRKSY